MRADAYHPHWLDQDGVVHIGNFTGPFTACGRNHVGWRWRNKVSVPATCVECLDYWSRNRG